jgi:hypothetical protein
VYRTKNGTELCRTVAAVYWEVACEGTSNSGKPTICKNYSSGLTRCA